MTVEDLIKELRSMRSGPNRVKATELVHRLERYSLGTEVTVPASTNADKLSNSNVNLEMKSGKLVITAAK